MSTEADRFGRYLIGTPPSPYVRDWYEAGQSSSPERFEARTRLDRLLLSMCSWGWMPLRAIDITARVLAPGAAVRRKLVFLTAVLANAPETWDRYDTPGVESRGVFFAGLAARGVVSALALCLGLIVTGVAYIGGGGR